MVRLHCLDHLLTHAEFLQDAAADFDVGAGDLVVHSFADVVEESSSTSDSFVGTQFSCEHARKVGNFDGVVEHILTVARTEVETSENHDELGVEVRNLCFEGRFSALLFNYGVDFLLGFLHGLLNLGGLDAAVENEVLKRAARYLTAELPSRCTAVTSISLARCSNFSLPVISSLRMRLSMSLSFCFSTDLRRSAFASSAERPAIFSSFTCSA